MKTERSRSGRRGQGKAVPCARARGLGRPLQASASNILGIRYGRLDGTNLDQRTWGPVTRTPCRLARPTPEQNALMNSTWHREPGTSSRGVTRGGRLEFRSGGTAIQVQPLHDEPDGRRQRTGAPAVARTAVCPASSHDLSELKQINRQPRRSATNLRADQQ